MSKRAVFVLAILGGTGWAIWPSPQGLVGRDWPADDPAMSWLLFVSVVIGTWSLAAATIGLVFAFQDRIRWGVALLGSIGALVGAVSVAGMFGAIVALPIGSAVLAWELGRVGGLSARLSTAHVAAAILWLVPIAAILANVVNFDDTATVVPLMTLMLPYAFSWIAIGGSFRHAASTPEEGRTGATRTTPAS